MVSAEKRRVQRVNALWEEGELARAAAAALPSRDPLRSDDVLEKLRDLFPPRPDGDHMPAPNPANGLNVDVRVRILAAVPKVLRTLPRRSGLGPSGSRFEHWMTIRGSDEGVRLAAELLVRLIEGKASPAVVAAHLSAQVAGHPKPNDPEGVRPLAIGGVLRRIALKAVCLAFSDDLRDACGPMQFAISRP